MFEWLQASGWTPGQFFLVSTLLFLLVSWALMQGYHNIFKDRS